MFSGEWTPIPRMSNQNVIIEACFKGIVGRITVVSLKKHMGRRRFRLYQFRNRKESHSSPSHLILTPGCDAVEIAHIFEWWQAFKICPRQLHWILNVAMNMERPITTSNLWTEPEIEHWKVLYLMLPRWQPPIRGLCGRRFSRHLPSPTLFSGDIVVIHESEASALN